MDTYQEPVTVCENKTVLCPYQDFIHQQMCLCDHIRDPDCKMNPNIPTVIHMPNNGGITGLNNGDIIGLNDGVVPDGWEFFPG